MKVVYVYPQFAHYAGTERILIDKMNYLSNIDGFEVFMVTYEQGSHPVAYPLSPMVKHIDLDVRLCSLYKQNLIDRIINRRKYTKLLHKRYNHLMAEIQPDIVIAVTYFSTIISMLVSCPFPCVKILESHTGKRYIHSNDPLSHQSLKSRIRGFLDMRTLNHSVSHFNLLVALNQNDAAVWTNYLKTRVIPNIVHLNDSGVFSNQESKKVIFVGRYTIQKGIPELIQIWERVFLKHPDWHLDLYGDGNMEVIPYSEEKLASFNIHVHEPDQDIFSRYMESSIFVLTSVYEPFGLVLPEAMSCGLPVVAFDCPFGPASIITDGVDGFLIKNRDINVFAEKLCLLMESLQLRQMMGKAAILSSQKYSADRIMPQWVSLFNELLGKPKS
jgi:glycosyltransferase involved in cell wall biosynthesis